MTKFELNFIPQQFVVGIGWHHNDDFTSGSHHWIVIAFLGPFTLMWSKPKFYFESLVSDLRKSTD